ncbi:GIY-YIG nuclease family protein [Streptomyces sp. EN16]|uniref:GIY-YIG nuclease family protein n=1 Tax=Streptomyces sp. EN16 TaxID=212773 RepID=UPI000851DEE5|nr:GIY-YIG nuclease family protein [Streptomyces sp. EN16]
MTDETTSERTALYRLFDADQQLLYVGITKDPKKRWRTHAQWARSSWWPSVTRKVVEWFPDREAADLAETAAINSEKPLHNLAKRERPGGPAPYFCPEIDWGWQEKRSITEQVADILRREIQEGRYAVGDPMPTRLDLKERFGMAPATAQKSLSILAKEGLTHQPGPKRRFICGPPSS